MTGYRLHVLRLTTVSRERAKAAWDEADRIEAMVLQEGVLDALKKIGVLVDVDDSEADSGTVQWLLWARGTIEWVDIVEGTPLGYLGVLKPKSLDFDDAPVTREWLERVRKERWIDPEPPAPGNILERLLEMVPRKEILESLDGRSFSDAEMILVGWSMYCSADLTDKGGGTLESRLQSRERQRKRLLRTMGDIRRCDAVQARAATLERPFLN